MRDGGSWGEGGLGASRGSRPSRGQKEQERCRGRLWAQEDRTSLIQHTLSAHLQCSRHTSCLGTGRSAAPLKTAEPLLSARYRVLLKALFRVIPQHLHFILKRIEAQDME